MPSKRAFKNLGSWSVFMKFYIYFFYFSVRYFIEINHMGSNVCEIRAMIRKK